MAENRRVLVVDDDDAIRTLVARVLVRANYDVGMASNGSEAVTELRTQPYRIVVLDLMMPVMSGFELVEYLASHDDAGHPCVIIVSAAGERDMQKVTSPLVHSVLRKPFDLPELIAAVARCAAHLPPA